jgi:hypothetical protein
MHVRLLVGDLVRGLLLLMHLGGACDLPPLQLPCCHERWLRLVLSIALLCAWLACPAGTSGVRIVSWSIDLNRGRTQSFRWLPVHWPQAPCVVLPATLVRIGPCTLVLGKGPLPLLRLDGPQLHGSHPVAVHRS